MTQLLRTYIYAGDADGYAAAMKRIEEKGLKCDEHYGSGVLAALINNPISDSANWDRIMKHYNENYKDHKRFRAYYDILGAAEKHGQIDVVYSWFAEFLNKVSDTLFYEKTKIKFQRIIGKERYDEYVKTLTPEQLLVLNSPIPLHELEDAVDTVREKPKAVKIVKTVSLPTPKAEKVETVPLPTPIAVKKPRETVEQRRSKEKELSTRTSVAAQNYLSSESKKNDGANRGPSAENFEDFLIDLKSRGLEPTQLHYSRVLAKCVESRDLVNGPRIYNDMKAAGILPNVAILRHLSQLYGNARDTEGTDSVIVEGAAAGLQPGKIKIITFTLLVSLSVCICVLITGSRP